MINFKRRHFKQDIIMMSMRWYLSYALSYRHVEELLLERGVSIDHSTVQGWVVRYSAELLNEFRRRYKKSGTTISWRLDETYVRGLTTSELQNLLKKRYLEFLVKPELKIRIAEFKRLRVLVRGEVRYPGLYKFPAYRSDLYFNLPKIVDDIQNNDTKHILNLSFKGERTYLHERKV